MTQIEKEAIDAACEAAKLYLPEAMRAALEAALPFLPIAGEGKVKPLEWTQKAPPAHDHEPFVYWAAGIGGHYRAERDGMLWFAHDAFVWEQFPSQEAAKAAAQSDYESRILSALISPPGKDGGQEVEAVGDRGEPCPNCKGEGCQTGDPEGAPLEACDYCNGSGKKRDTQPASTALVEALEVARDQIITMYRTWVVDDATAMPTEISLAGRAVAKIDAALAASTSREGESRG